MPPVEGGEGVCGVCVCVFTHNVQVLFCGAPVGLVKIRLVWPGAGSHRAAVTDQLTRNTRNWNKTNSWIIVKVGGVFGEFQEFFEGKSENMGQLYIFVQFLKVVTHFLILVSDHDRRMNTANDLTEHPVPAFEFFKLISVHTQKTSEPRQIQHACEQTDQTAVKR